MKSNGNRVAFELFRANLKDFYELSHRIMFGRDISSRENVLKTIKSNVVLKNKFLLSYQCKSISELGIKRLYYNDFISSKESIEIAASIIDVCADSINEFCRLRKEYEKYLSLGKAECAGEILHKIEKTIGYSLWGLSQRYIIAQIKGGTQSNNEEWRKSAEKVPKNDIVQFLLVNYKNLADEDLSYTQYMISLEQRLKGESSVIKRYFFGKLRIDNLVFEDDRSLLIQIDSSISLIDLFITYERILLSMGRLFFKNNGDNELCKILPAEIINTPIINNLRIILANEFGKVLVENTDPYSILDLYTQGKYERVIELCEQYLKIAPQDFQFTCIYCKSLLHLCEINVDCAISDYARNVYSVYAFGDDVEDASILLQKQMRRYHGIGLGIKIRSFLERKNIIEGSYQFCYASFLLDEIPNPNILKQLDDSRIDTIIDYFKQYCTESVMTIFGIITGNNEIIPSTVDTIRATMDKIQCACKKREFEEASYELNELKKLTCNSNLYIHERALQSELRFYIISNQYLNAVHLLVDIFFRNKKLFQRILNKRLFILNYRCKDKNVKSDISHMILSYLVLQTEYDKQIIVYNNLLSSNGISNVEMCEKFLSGKDEKKWRFFFSKVCTVDLLKRDSYLYSMKIPPENARYRILEILYNKYRNAEYEREMFEIQKLQSVRDKLKTIENGRINVDTEKIFLLKEEIWQETFDRYRKIPRIDSPFYYLDNTKNSEFQLGTLSSSLVLKVITQYEQKKMALSDLIRTIVFELLFNENYGLETYLSARIRHGYCKGQMVSFLQKLDLISFYDERMGRNILPQYWANQLGESADRFEDVSKIIFGFTHDIENKVEEVLKNWLRIKISESDQGLFDYRIFFSDEWVNSYYKEIEENLEFNRLYKDITQIFWICTDENLKAICKRIDGELRDYYINSIQKIEAAIHERFGIETANDDVYRELYSRCQRAKSDLVGVLQQLKEAFVHLDNGYQDFNLDELANCIYRLFHNQMTTTAKNWKIKADSKTIIEGKYFLPLVDIMCILVNNAFGHSGFQDRTKVKITMDLKFIKEEDVNIDVINEYPNFGKNKKYLRITVMNNLHPAFSDEMVKRKLKHAFNNITKLGQEMKVNQREGGTGLTKMCNIIEYQLYSLYYTEYSVNDRNVSVSCVLVADSILTGVR